MAQYLRSFPSFIGGEEKTFAITHAEREEAHGPEVVLDLTDYAIGAEVWWEGCLRQHPIIEIVSPTPTGDEPHYRLTLNEAMTLHVPLGRVAYCKLIRVSPSGVTTIRAPIYLNRIA